MPQSVSVLGINSSPAKISKCAKLLDQALKESALVGGSLIPCTLQIMRKIFLR